MKSASLAVASLVLAVVTGSLAFRALYLLIPAVGFTANPLPGLAIVGVCLLFSGYTYRRRFFSTSLDCALGVIVYALAVTLFAVYITGADAVAGFMDGWIVWLVLAPLAPWFAGFFVANRGVFRSRKSA